MNFEMGAIFAYLLNPGAILVLSAGAVLFFVVVSVILVHHWNSHTLQVEKMKKVRRIYFVGGAILIFAALVSALIIVFP